MSPHRLRRRVAVAALALAMVVSVAAGPAAATASIEPHRTGTTQSAVAQYGGGGTSPPAETTHDLHVTKRFYPDPDGGDPIVEWVVENPEIVDRSDVDRVTVNVTGTGFVNVTRGFSHVEGGVYELTGSTDRAVLYRRNGGSIGNHFEKSIGEFRTVVPDDRGHENCPDGTDDCRLDAVRVRAETDYATTVAVNYSYAAPGEGFVTGPTARSEVILDNTDTREKAPLQPLVGVGPHERYTASAGDATIVLVVPDALRTRTDPRVIVEQLETVLADVEGGVHDRTIYAIAKPNPGRGRYSDAAAGRAPGLQGQYMTVSQSAPVYTANNVWLHEYLHTGQPGTLTDEMAWFSEGRANYQMLRLQLANGYGDFDALRTRLESGRENPGAAYSWGALVYGAVDRQIRLATDGRNSTADVVDRMVAHDGSVDRSDFVRFVGAVSNETVADRTRAWVRQERLPQAWTLEEHQRVYGPVPNVETAVTGIERRAEDGVESVGTDDPVVVETDQRLAVDVRLRNDGDGRARYRVELANRSDRPINGMPVRRDDATGTLAGGGERTVTLSAQFTEAWNRTVEVGQPVQDGYTQGALTVGETVDVVAVDAVVAADGPNDDPVREAIVTDANQRTAFEAAPHTTVHVGQASYDTGADGTVVVDSLPIQPGETVAVTFGSGSDASTQYVSSLYPIEGTVPTDPDHDGDFEDLNGDGTIDDRDVELYFEYMEDSSMTRYVPAYDYNDNGELDYDDLTRLDDEAA